MINYKSFDKHEMLENNNIINFEAKFIVPDNAEEEAKIQKIVCYRNTKTSNILFYTLCVLTGGIFYIL